MIEDAYRSDAPGSMSFLIQSDCQVSKLFEISVWRVVKRSAQV